MRGSHQLGQRAAVELLGADLDHVDAVAGGAGGDLRRVRDAVALHRIRKPVCGNSITHSLTLPNFSSAGRSTSTAMSPENSSRTRSGLSTVRASDGRNLVHAGPAVARGNRQQIGPDAEPHMVADQAAWEIRPVQFEILVAQAAGVAAGIETEDLHRQQVEDAQQPRDVDVGGLLENFARRAGLHDAAFAHDDHFVAEVEAFLEIVRDQQHRDSKFLAHLAEHGVEFGLERRVQTLGRLVEQAAGAAHRSARARWSSAASVRPTARTGGVRRPR